MKSETEEDAKNTGVGRVRLRARKSLTLRQFWLILRKKGDCFAVYPANERLDWPSLGWPREDGAPFSWEEVKQCHELAHAYWSDTIR